MIDKSKKFGKHKPQKRVDTREPIKHGTKLPARTCIWDEAQEKKKWAQFVPEVEELKQSTYTTYTQW